MSSPETTPHNPYRAPTTGPRQATLPVEPPVSYQPGGRVATSAFVLLLANAVVSVLTGIFWIVMWVRLARMSVTVGWLQSVLVQTLLLTIANGVLVILTAVLFSIWYYRSYRNLLALGNAATDHGLWWAPAGFYIPVVNLFMPYLVGREIWLKSDPINLRRGPRDRRLMPRNRSAGLVAAWWLCLVCAQLLSRVATSGMEHLRLDRLGSLFFLLILAALLSTVAAVLGALLVRAVERRQQLRHAAMGSAAQGPDSG